MKRKSRRHHKAVRRRAAKHHGGKSQVQGEAPAKKAGVEADVERSSEAANRGFDAYDRIDYGYDLSRGLVGDTPPDRTGAPDRWEVDPYAPS